MSVAFFSFSETDRDTVLLIKGRAVNPRYSALDFRVQDLLLRWDTTNPAVIRQAISKSMYGTSRTLVFVGHDTCRSRWVPEEVEMTLEAGKAVHAIALHTYAVVPSCLSQRGVTVHEWSESTLQWLATR